jgi:hypothetical protein
MDISKIHAAGILRKDEEIAEQMDCNYRKVPDKNWPVNGTLLLTNKRLIFVKKLGWRSKGADLLFTCSLGAILSISVSGIFSKQINLTLDDGKGHRAVAFSEGRDKTFAEKIIEHKRDFVEEKTIEAQKVIIEEAKKESAEEILKKKLARGEIDKEEFHDKIQRT